MTLDHATLTGIRFYQRRLSPHKGFRCAHAALHGGPSCSAVVRRVIEERGVRRGWPDIIAQFRACRAAHAQLRLLPAGRTSGGVQGQVRARGVCCLGPIPIPFRCG